MQEWIRLPKMELSMEEGKIQKWLIVEGDFANKGDLIAEIETDKAVVELEMPMDGQITSLLIAEGELVSVGTPIAEMSPSLEENVTNAMQRTQETVVKDAVDKVVVENYTNSLELQEDIQRVAISPAARRRARELGVDFAKLSGSGPRGRIVYRDLETTEKSENHTLPTLSKMRRTIAKRMLESVTTIPQFSIKRTVDVSKPMEIKQVIQSSLSQKGIKLSFTDFLISAVAKALIKHPALNASFIGSPLYESCRIVEHKAVNIGLAVSTVAGLVVTVIHDAEQLTLSEIAKIRMDKVEGVRNQSLKVTDVQGGTFTISNLGMYDVDEFQAIVNPPEAGILAIGSIRQFPMQIEGKLEFRPVITLTGSFDHRAVDGAAAAEFMRSLATQLSSDEWILI